MQWTSLKAPLALGVALGHFGDHVDGRLDSPLWEACIILSPKFGPAFFKSFFLVYIDVILRSYVLISLVRLANF